MKLNGNTIFITGSTSGIGLGLALAFSKLGNTVIISGRDESVLKELNAQYPKLITRVCDVSVEADLIATAEWLQKNHSVNVLINNAGIMHPINFAQGADLSILEEEMRINYLGPVKLISLLLPTLQKNKNPVIIIVSSGLAYTPLAQWPLYSATKAALHSFSISLRDQLKKTSVKVIEILPPAVETKLTADSKLPKMPLDKFLRKTIKALGAGTQEIAIGQSKLLYYFARISPSLMNYILNRIGE